MRLVAVLLLSSLATAQCDKSAWIIEDDGIAGVVTMEGNPVRHAAVHLSSSGLEYKAVTDGEGRFSIRPVPAGNYSFAITRWGKHQLQVKAWERGKINRPGLVFSKQMNCLLMLQVSH